MRPRSSPAGAVHAHAALDVRPGETVLVLGGGVMGLLAVAVARHGNAGLIVLSTRSRRKQEIGRDFGADIVLGDAAGVPAVAGDLTDGIGFDVVVETAGGSETVGLAGTATAEVAVAAVRRGGRGPGGTWMKLTIGSIVDACLWAEPGAPAATLGDGQRSFRQLDSFANQCARVLAAHGAGPGDLVAWWAGAALRTLDGFLACARLGGVFAPVNPALPPEEAGATLEYLQPRVLVADAEHAEPAAVLAAQLAIPLLVFGARRAPGRDATRHQAMRMVAVEGRIGLFGVEKPGLSTYPLAEVFRRRPTIEMTWGAQFEPGLASFAEAAADVTSGVAGISGLVSHQIAVDGIDQAFQLAGDPQAGALKVAITFGSGQAGPESANPVSKQGSGTGNPDSAE